MARLITKFKYLKPEDRKNVGGYAEYIATREGVEKIDESKRNAPATNKQKQLIKKILSDFPDSRSSLEYEDYLKEKTVGAASEFITRALEENADEMMHTKTYADYIATRPRAERIGSHGLFTDDGVAVDLQKVSDELNAHTGNVWTAIVSLRREDAERLGFDNGSRWRDMLRSQTLVLLTFSSTWSMSSSNMVFSEQIKLLPNIMSQIASGGLARMGASMASSVLMMLPPMIIYLFSQSNIIETMSNAGMKD